MEEQELRNNNAGDLTEIVAALEKEYGALRTLLSFPNRQKIAARLLLFVSRRTDRTTRRRYVQCAPGDETHSERRSRRASYVAFISESPKKSHPDLCYLYQGGQIEQLEGRLSVREAKRPTLKEEVSALRTLLSFANRQKNRSQIYAICIKAER